MLHVAPPDAVGIAAIMKYHLRGALADADLVPLAKLAPGATGADAAQWVGDARRIARLAGRDVVLADLVAVMAPDDGRSPSDLEVAAVHEAGHVVGAVLAGWPVGSVSIVARGAVGGRTGISSRMPACPTKADVDLAVMVGLAAMAAEVVVIGAASMGAEDDLAGATALLAAIHASSGLGDSLLFRAPADKAAAVLAGDERLRAAVSDHLDRVYARTLALMKKHRGAVVALAAVLRKRRFIDGAEAEKIVRAALASPGRQPPKRRAP